MPSRTNFFTGIHCALEGVRIFFGEPRLWKFVWFPLSILALLYAVILWAAFRLGFHLSDMLREWASSLPSWLGSILGGGALILCIAAACFLLISGFSILYGAFAGVFFDAMAESFEKLRFGRERAPNTVRTECLFIWDSILYGSGTLILFLALSLAGLIVPVLGQILFVVFMAYRFGMVCLMSTGFNHGMRVCDLKKLAARNGAACLGFGLTAYAMIMLIPLAAVFALPGLVAGGALLFHEMTEEGNIPEKTLSDLPRIR